MSPKKRAKRKAAAAKPMRFRFVKDNDGHTYLIEADQIGQFETWLEAGPYWDWNGYEGEDFNIYRVDGTGQYTFTDPQQD
jgi:hypothetical protein